MAEVQNDPDRVLHPLRRRPDGSFERVTWDAALDEIGERLGAIREQHGGSAVGWYMGNPGAFSYSHPLWVKGFLDALGSPHSYTASSQDVSNRFAASQFLYGSPFIVPIPDLARTELPARRRRQPAGLARQRAERPARQGPAARDHRPRRPGRGRRPAALGDRARLRARRDRSRRRRLDAALDARGDLRRGARGPRRDRAPGHRHPRPAPARRRISARGDRGPQRRARAAAFASWPATSPAPSARPSTGAPARAWGATGRWSRSCSTRSTSSPATSTGTAARCSGIRRSTSAASPTSPGWRATAGSARASATCPRCSARCPRR